MVGGDSAEPMIRVLIADDDHRVRAALRAFLSAHRGFDIIGEAPDSTVALELARRHRPTVALVDVYLPELSDGLALLRALAGELRIPVVAISLDGDAQSSALAAGAYLFVDKESVLDSLLGALRLSVEHGR